MSDTLNENQPPIAPPEPDAPAEPEWQGPTPEEWQATQERLQALEPLAETFQQFEQQQYQQQPQQGQVQLPDGTLLSEQDVEFLRSMWQQDMTPLADYTQQSQMAETEEKAKDIISDIAARNDFEFKDEREQNWIRDRADSYVEQAVAKHGVGPHAAEAALEMAFNEFREIMGAREQARVDQEINQLRTLGSAPMQPTPTAPAAQALAAPTGGPRQVLQKYFPGS